MKRFCSITAIAAFLLFCLNGLHAQTAQPKLNQVELMKQFIGTWKCEIGKDTTYFWEAKSYGTGLDCYSKYVTKGRIFKKGKDICGYDRSINKFIDAELIKGNDMEITVIWFVSDKNYEETLYSNIPNLDMTSSKMIGEFKSPDTHVETYTVNNKPIKTWIYTRVK
jgi:hypothetical protein